MRKSTSESCKWSIYRTGTLPILLFKEYLKILSLTSVKQNALWRKNDAAVLVQISFILETECITDSHFLPRARLAKAKKFFENSLEKRRMLYQKQLNRLCRLSKVIRFPSISYHFSTQHQTQNSSNNLKNEVCKPTGEGT